MKTLKELVEENEGSSTCEDYGYESCVKPSSLRAAAVEEIKEITRVGFIDDPDDAIDNECNDRLVAWIKHFFNLSESDLK